jgi:hypothetical protein
MMDLRLSFSKSRSKVFPQRSLLMWRSLRFLQGIPLLNRFLFVTSCTIICPWEGKLLQSEKCLAAHACQKCSALLGSNRSLSLMNLRLKISRLA